MTDHSDNSQQEYEIARIVVGIDGSEESKAALRWAARLATTLDAAVEAVIAWQWPANSGWAYTPTGWDPAHDAAKTLERALDEVFGKGKPGGLRTVVEEGNAVRVLLEQSKDADMLVVGSRGIGGFMGMLLGSVSANCAEHATCPVLVVHCDDPK